MMDISVSYNGNLLPSTSKLSLLLNIYDDVNRIVAYNTLTDESAPFAITKTTINNKPLTNASINMRLINGINFDPASFCQICRLLTNTQPIITINDNEDISIVEYILPIIIAPIRIFVFKNTGDDAITIYANIIPCYDNRITCELPSKIHYVHYYMNEFINAFITINDDKYVVIMQNDMVKQKYKRSSNQAAILFIINNTNRNIFAYAGKTALYVSPKPSGLCMFLQGPFFPIPAFVPEKNIKIHSSDNFRVSIPNLSKYKFSILSVPYLFFDDQVWSIKVETIDDKYITCSCYRYVQLS